MKWFAATLFAVCMLAATSKNAAAQDLKDRFNFRAIFSGMYSGESQNAATSGVDQASAYHILYGDLRLILDGRRLASDSFDVHVDVRVRATGDFDSGYTSQGYMNGREYEVHELWGKYRGTKIDFGFGRLVVAEADALRLDGLRLWAHLAKHWELSVFGGSLPNPYSRSVTDDYVAGAYAFAGGAAVAYTYDRIWGSFSAVGSYLGGPGDGGPAVAAACTAENTTACALLAATNVKDEITRSYVTWTNYVRPLAWFDFYNDIVVDVAGAAGAQLTRLDALATARIGKWGTLRLGYDHMSSIALDNYLHHFLFDRNAYATYLTQGMIATPATIENDVAVERTAFNEGRLQFEVLAKDTTLYTEGRVRQRAILQESADYRFFTGNSQVAPGIAGDATLGVRNRGSLAGLRTGAYGMYIQDYRSQNFVASFNLGRSFANDFFSFDAQFLYSWSKDAAATTSGTATQCPGSMNNSFSILTTCFGGRKGNMYEVGLTPTMLLSRHWFLMADYRLVIDQASMTLNNNAIISNNIFLRVEARY